MLSILFAEAVIVIVPHPKAFIHISIVILIDVENSSISFMHRNEGGDARISSIVG